MRDQQNKSILHYLALDLSSRLELLREQRRQLFLQRTELEGRQLELIRRRTELEEERNRLHQQQDKSL